MSSPSPPHPQINKDGIPSQEELCSTHFTVSVLRLIITHYHATLSHYPQFFEIMSGSVLCNLTLLLFHEQVNALIFNDIMAIFVIVAEHLQAHFKKELELFFEKVVFHFLGSISAYRSIDRFVMERSLLETLYELLSRDGAVEEYFRNYDCDPYSLNVMSILFSIVVVASRTNQ